LKQSPDGGYTLHAFGKNGEVKKNHEINLGIKHTFVNRKINVLLKTNVQGFIELGELGYVQYIDYSGPMGTYKQWEIFSYMHTLLPPAVCVPANTDFKISSPISLDYSWHSLYKNGNG
jgi:hypothetical protein